MDIELVRNFKKLINTNFNELIISLIEQSNSENERLNEIIISLTALVKEKETLIQELQKELEDKQFDEDNFNNVSLIHNLNKQVETLTVENKLLNTSLEARRKNDKLKSQKVVEEHLVEPEQEKVVENNEVPVEVEVENDTEVEQNTNDAENDADNNDNVDNEVENNDNVDNEVENAENVEDNQEEDDEETVEVEEIEVNDKAYYVKDNKIYNKKKNGDMGSKQVGEMDNGEPVIYKKKDKKEKKDNKNKKDKKNNN